MTTSQRCLVCLTLFASIGISTFAFAQGGDISAADLAGRLSAAVEDGDSVKRLRMSIQPASGESQTLQVQIKSRRSGGSVDMLYQVLWPTERKGESVLLHKKDGQPAQGYHFQLPKTMNRIDSGKLTEPLLGSALTYADVVENFFQWDTQTLAGNETVGRVECVILESKPGSGDSTPYSKVRSWIDPEKMVVMKVEKYGRSGNLARTVETTQVATDDRGNPIPAALKVTGSGGGVTEIDGSSIRHDVSFTDADFETQAMTDFSINRK